MSGVIDQKRALSFKENAELYDEVRPCYPESWIADLQQLAKASDKTKILEIGSGTGKATTDLLKISKRITCMDPGKEMLDIARRRFPELTFVESTFEAFASKEVYDLIVSAMAWHWVDPAVGYKKAWDLLAESGFLAIIRYYHIDADPRSFHNRAQHIYERYNKITKTKRHAEQLKRIKKDAEALNNQYFGSVKQIEYEWKQDYSIDDYLALRNTYSDHLTMEPGQREKMEDELREFAEKEFDGKVVKKYTTVLFVAQKKNQ